MKLLLILLVTSSICYAPKRPAVKLLNLKNINQKNKYYFKNAATTLKKIREKVYKPHNKSSSTDNKNNK